MEAIENVFTINWTRLILDILIILSGITAGVVIVDKFFEVVLGKPIKWFKKSNEDHELLVKTAKELKDLEEKHNTDVSTSTQNECNIQNDISELREELRESFKEIQKQMKQFGDNRIHDREQSFQIQKQLTDSITIIATTGKKRDGQISSLMNGMMELLGDKIDEKFSRYVSLGGIPEDEVDEFTGICHAYFGVGGNHKREEKYNYVKDNMKIIPVKSKLLIDK